MMQIISPASHAAVALITTDLIMKRTGRTTQKERVEKCFGFRHELALAWYATKFFNDPSIFEYEKQQLMRVAQGALDPGGDDLEFDFLVPKAPFKINAKGTLNEHLVSSKRHADVCFVLGRPADKSSHIMKSEDMPIELVGWCMGTELEIAPTWMKVPLYCHQDKLRPREKLWF